MPADMDIHISHVHMCLRHVSVCWRMQIQINVYIYTYIPGVYMHMHALLVFTLYVKYLQFLILIQCTKMLHE